MAALIAEPIQGVGGFATPPDGFFGRLKKVLDQHGILFIADEVQTGWGRTGDHFWGWQAHGLVPDLLTFAKGVGNGVALGGVVGRGRDRRLPAREPISTFGGNAAELPPARWRPSAYLLDHDLQANAAREGARFRAALPAGRRPHRGDRRGARQGPDAGARDRAGRAARARRRRRDRAAARRPASAGLLIGKGGLYGNVLRIAPPLTVTAEEIDEAASILAKAIDSIVP